jgi:hypothetical protein
VGDGNIARVHGEEVAEDCEIIWDALSTVGHTLEGAKFVLGHLCTVHITLADNNIEPIESFIEQLSAKLELLDLRSVD